MLYYLRKAELSRLAPHELEQFFRDKGNTKNDSDSMLTYRKKKVRSSLGAEILVLDKEKRKEERLLTSKGSYDSCHLMDFLPNQ